MMNLMDWILAFALGVFIVLAAVLISFALATRLAYGFRWRAILGLERQALRRDIWYVSKSVFLPTAVFWLGSTEDQEKQVAIAMAMGHIKRRHFPGTVSRETNWKAIVAGVRVWPDLETKQMFGDPNDVAQEAAQDVLQAEFIG